jgi:hypothetical protein
MRWTFIDCNIENDYVQPTLVWPFGGTLWGNGWDSPVGLGFFPLNYKPDWLFQTVFLSTLFGMIVPNSLRFSGWVKPTRNFHKASVHRPFPGRFCHSAAEGIAVGVAFSRCWWASGGDLRWFDIFNGEFWNVILDSIYWWCSLILIHKWNLCWEFRSRFDYGVSCWNMECVKDWPWSF